MELPVNNLRLKSPLNTLRLKIPLKTKTPATLLYIEEAGDEIALDNATGIDMKINIAADPCPQYTIGDAHKEQELLLIGRPCEARMDESEFYFILFLE